MSEEKEVLNPILGLNPKMKCPCKSGKQFKDCCLTLTLHHVPVSQFKAWLRVKDLAIRGKKAW